MTQQHMLPPAGDTRPAYVPFGGRHTHIGREAARPTPEFATLSWCSGRAASRPQMDNGKPVIDETTGEVTMENIFYAGFFCDIGEDEALDAAMEATRCPRMTISHQEGISEHWAFPRSAMVLIAEGLQSKSAMSSTTARLGVAYGWRQSKAGRKESYLYLQVLPKFLLGHYDKPLVLAVKSTQTEDALSALRRQYDVIAAAHHYLRTIGADMEIPLWMYGAPMGPAKKAVSRGAAGRQSDIFPIVSLVPERISPDYLQKMEIPEESIDLLSYLSSQSVEWSTSLVERINSESGTLDNSGIGGR